MVSVLQDGSAKILILWQCALRRHVGLLRALFSLAWNVSQAAHSS